jgi:hypothetical protein
VTATPRRRRSAACSLGAAAILGVLSAYQTGLLRHLPDLPGRVFDADLVDGSGEAYWVFSAADAPLGMTSFALTAALAGDRRLTRAWTAKAAVDAAYAVALAVEQPVRFRRLCAYCLAVTGLAFAAFRLALGESTATPPVPPAG